MSTISNRFFVTALDDGTTLHGNLSSTIALVQAFDGGAPLPNWESPDNQPIVYLTLLNGSSIVSASFINDIVWAIDGIEITFNTETAVSTGAWDGYFQRVQYLNGNTYVPALKILKNLANSDYVSISSISLHANFKETSSSAPLPFGANIQVRITTITDTSYLGVINFVDGKSNIISTGDSVILYATLYGQNGEEASTYQVAWYVNNESRQGTGSYTPPGSGKSYPSLTLTDDDVVDYAVVRAVFSLGGEELATAYAGVDDLKDSEFMYIQYNNSNGNAASLRTGEEVAFSIFVGSNVDATPNPQYQTYKVQLLNREGVLVDDELPSIPNADEDGWRTLTTTNAKASITITYEVVSGELFNKNLTGIVLASTEE